MRGITTEISIPAPVLPGNISMASSQNILHFFNLSAYLNSTVPKFVQVEATTPMGIACPVLKVFTVFEFSKENVYIPQGPPHILDPPPAPSALSQAS